MTTSNVTTQDTWIVKTISKSPLRGILSLIFSIITALTLYYHFISYQPTWRIEFNRSSPLTAGQKHHQPHLDEDRQSMPRTPTATTTKTMTTTTTAMKRVTHPSSWWRAAKKRLRSSIQPRLDSIRRFCSNGKNSHVVRSHEQKELYRSMYLADEQHLAYCSIAKTGTNTWLSHLMSMNDNTTLKHAYLHGNRALLKRMMNSEYFSGDKKVDLSDSVVFAFTRHPFSRLVSGYNHALVGTSLQLEFKEMNKRIIEFTGPNRVNFTGLFSKVARPREFVRYLVHQVDTEGWTNVNVHFKSQWQSCPFCLNIFDFVGHQSTFREDVATINSILDLNLKPQLATGHVDRSKWKVNNFFSTLEAKDVIDLHRIFREDFEMLGFNNNIDEYLNMKSGRQAAALMRKSKWNKQK